MTDTSLSGWLVPNDQADEFSKRFLSFAISDVGMGVHTFAVWSVDEVGEPEISFLDKPVG